MSKNKFKIFNPFYLECHMTLSTGVKEDVVHNPQFHWGLFTENSYGVQERYKKQLTKNLLKKFSYIRVPHYYQYSP
jgi:hypothetical protein